MCHWGEKGATNLFHLGLIYLDFRNITAYYKNLGAFINDRGVDLNIAAWIFRFKKSVDNIGSASPFMYLYYIWPQVIISLNVRRVPKLEGRRGVRGAHILLFPNLLFDHICADWTWIRWSLLCNINHAKALNLLLWYSTAAARLTRLNLWIAEYKLTNFWLQVLILFCF